MKAEDRYDSLFKFYAHEAGFIAGEWRLFKAQVKQESGFNPDIKNKHSGATGLAQFMPKTWEEWRDSTPGIQSLGVNGQLVDWRDPEDAIKAQIHYMKWLLKAVGNHWDKALAAYNWGIGNIWKAEKKEGVWTDHLPNETADYIVKINRYYREYQHEALKSYGC